MPRQASLFLDDHGLTPYRPYVQQDTSQQAAAAMPKTRAATLRDRILALLMAQPMTDYAIGQAMGIEGNTVRPRRGELVMRGLVVDSGKRSKLPSGRRAILWTATQEKT